MKKINNMCTECYGIYTLGCPNCGFETEIADVCDECEYVNTCQYDYNPDECGKLQEMEENHYYKHQFAF
jgi:hypothetical protein